MVALVRGVHGLNGAVRVEVLTDRPEDRFVVGTVLYREGDERPLTIATAEAVADGPGWRIRFREVATRDGADGLRGAYLESVVRADEDLARGSYYWHEVIGCAVHGVDGAELGTVKDIYRIGETEVFTVDGGPYGVVRPAGGARLHPDLRAASWRDRGRRRVARPASAAVPGAGSRPAEGATPADAEQGGSDEQWTRRAPGDRRSRRAPCD